MEKAINNIAAAFAFIGMMYALRSFNWQYQNYLQVLKEIKGVFS